MSRIIIFLKSQLESLPPVSSCAQALSESGMQVEIIVNSCKTSTIEFLQKKKIIVHPLFPNPQRSKSGVFAKAKHWLAFRKFAWKTYQDIAQEGDILWMGSADTALALGKKICMHRYVLHIHELYDTLPYYIRHLKSFAQNAIGVIVPEMSRAAIFRVWWGLKRTPFVVPNKPFDHPRDRNLEITDETIRKQIADIGDMPIVLYQGHIEKGRTLDVLAKAIRHCQQQVQLVLMGRDHGNFVEHLTKICPNLINLGFVTPPHHLEVTSHATMGIIQYNFSCLNHVFCAPNKIWEYAGFSIPALTADLPALRYYYDRFQAGICCDFDSETEIASAIDSIVKNRGLYVESSQRLFESCDISELYRNVLSLLENQ